MFDKGNRRNSFRLKEIGCNWNLWAIADSRRCSFGIGCESAHYEDQNCILLTKRGFFSGLLVPYCVFDCCLTGVN